MDDVVGQPDPSKPENGAPPALPLPQLDPEPLPELELPPQAEEAEMADQFQADPTQLDPEPLPELELPPTTENLEPADSPLPTDSVLSALLESLLFVADTPVSAAQLAQALGLEEGVAQAGLESLEADYVAQERGLRLQRRGGRYLLVTMPEAASAVEAFLNLDLNSRLSGPALETLAIVAYRQPVTRAQVEAIRGVDCGGVLRTLLNRELIEEGGRLESVGRPILYGVTDRFMQHFGLANLEQLPPLPESDAEALWAAGDGVTG